MSKQSAVPEGYHLTKCFTVRDIQNAVADSFDVAREDMTSRDRRKKKARARQVAMYLTRQLTPYSLPRIGVFFGGRDHTTVIHAIRATEAMLSNNEQIAVKVQALRHALGDKPPISFFCASDAGA